MYQDCLNTYILDIKCKFARLAATSSDSLALLSKKADCQLFKAKIIDLYLHELQCYKAFRSQVFGAWSIDIVPSTIEDYNITLTLNTGTYLVSGTMSSEQLIIELYNLLKIDTNLDVNYTDNTLYIISYVNTLTYNDTITLTDSVLIDFNSITELQGNESIFLNLTNCLTEEDIEAIIRHSYKLLNSTSSSKCGC